jgi:guanine deaminase
MTPEPAAPFALRGPALTFVDDPFAVGAEAAVRYEPDALIAIERGRVRAFGPFDRTRAALAPGASVTRYGTDHLILPGLVDLHAHYPQTRIVGAFGRRLLDWLDEYTFPAEARFADPAHAREVAELFLRECLRAGTTTAMVYCTVHPASVDAFFEASERAGTRMVAGKVLMDRHAPAGLLDTAQRGYDESKALLGRWHGRGRQLYAVTPRFAPTSSPAQLEAAAALWRESPGSYLQSHVSETRDEVAWVRSLHPERRGYLDVYAHHGLLGRGAVYAHGVWLEEDELRLCAETGTALAHCPSSNLFLGSGLFRLAAAKRAERPVRVGVGTDVGAGTSFSLLRTLGEAYKVAQLGGAPLAAAHALYLATRGAAEALGLEHAIGSIAPGAEADLVVLDLHSTPLIAERMRACRDVHEALFVQMTLGDDRAVRATFVAGALRHERDGGGARC